MYVPTWTKYDLEKLESGLNYFVQITDEGGSVSQAKVASNSFNTNATVHTVYHHLRPDGNWPALWWCAMLAFSAAPCWALPRHT